MEPDDEAERKKIEDYTRQLGEKLELVVAMALGDLQPASFSFGVGKTGFAMNRREQTEKGVRIGVNPAGPVDHRVPVLRVMLPSGKVRAVLFGYACHNTTLTAEFYDISGDYAGEAAAELESGFPGSVALFFEMCAGDQNPNPRSKVELAAAHGKALAGEVARVVRGEMGPVTGQVKGAYQLIDLPFAPHTREQFEKEAAETDKFRVRRAKGMLALYDERREPRKLQYPVQAIRFEKGFTMIALAGEVVVDYALWAYKEFPNEPLMVAGYSNDVPCYIPSARILREGGYEAVDSMIYYGQPGPFTEEVEPRIQHAVRGAMKRLGVK
jgi:hypothetical protein